MELYTITIEPEQNGEINQRRLTGTQDAGSCRVQNICLPGKRERNIDINKQGLNPVRENTPERLMRASQRQF